MKHIYITVLCLFETVQISCQSVFPKMFEVSKLCGTTPTTVSVPVSPIKSQILFVGGIDTVAHTAIPARHVNNKVVYGEPAGTTLAKEWHDFIGFTPATPIDKAVMQAQGHYNFLGWISCNHEMIWHDNKLGDGGGMTVYAIKRDTRADTLVIVKQDLSKEGFPGG
ncbi:MAG TPA: hypothetical protein VL947_07410, partial [Cytophagales bacterium]|nr:hypothetical protein [Cytophagales bacterium]